MTVIIRRKVDRRKNSKQFLAFLHFAISCPELDSPFSDLHDSNVKHATVDSPNSVTPFKKAANIN